MEIQGSFYLRLTVEDRPGQLAKVADCLAEHEVSLATVSQRPKSKSATSTVILTTHDTNEHSMNMAIQSLETLQGVIEKPVLFRVFDPNAVSKG